MSPCSLRVPVQKVDLKYVGTGALCAVFNNSNINVPQADFHPTEEGAQRSPVKSTDNINTGNNEVGVNEHAEFAAVKNRRRISPENTIATAFFAHANALLKSAPSSLLGKRVLHFLKQDWYDLVQLRQRGRSDCTEDIKSRWRQIESLMEDTDYEFLQEGTLLLSFLIKETNVVSDFHAAVEDIEIWIMNRLGDALLPDEIRFQLIRFKEEVLQCQREVANILRSEMSENKKNQALVKQQQQLYAQITAVLNCTPQFPLEDTVKRKGYKCLMSLQECQFPPLVNSRLAALSKTLRAIAGNTSEPELFHKALHTNYATLRDLDEFPTSQAVSLLAAQCNDILSQHGHLIAPVVANMLRSQGNL